MAAAKKTGKNEDPNFKMILDNKKVRFDFHILETYEAGIVLAGSEIKSIRQRAVVINDAYVRIKNGEAFIIGMKISLYNKGGKFFNHEPYKDRKLLLHRREIDAIVGKVQRKGLTILPVSIYIKDNRAKLCIGLAKSKQQYDKKQDIIDRHATLEAGREIKRRSRNIGMSGD